MPFMANLGALWRNKARQLNLSSHDVVIIQTGARGMSMVLLDEAINKKVATFRVELGKVRDELNRSRTPLFFITQPPFSDSLNGLEGRGNRNNVAIAAVNSLLVTVAVELGVPVHGVFRLLISRLEENVCEVTATKR